MDNEFLLKFIHLTKNNLSNFIEYYFNITYLAV